MMCTKFQPNPVRIFFENVKTVTAHFKFALKRMTDILLITQKLRSRFP